MENHQEKNGGKPTKKNGGEPPKKDGEKPSKKNGGKPTKKKWWQAHQVEKKKEVNSMEKSTEELVDILITISVISRMIAKKLMMEGEDTNEKRRCSRCSD